jgi:phosphoglycolate phosphatase-like HAD superfamily hydrolase
MKKIFLKVTLFISALSGFNISEANPRLKVFVFDMDEVFVDARLWHIGSYFTLKSLVMSPSLLWRMSTNGSFRKKVKTIFSKKNKIKDPETHNSFSFKLVELARIYKPLRSSFDTLMKRINYSGRKLIDDVIEVIKELKDRGYTIIVATNRDRMGFELTAKKLGFDQLYNGQRLFDAVVVGGIKDIVERTTINGKRFSRLTTNQAYDTYITQAPAYKPDTAYYAVVRSVVDNYVAAHADKFDTTSPGIVFFDDKQENIDGANNSNLDIEAYQISSKHKGLSLRKNASIALGMVL